MKLEKLKIMIALMQTSTNKLFLVILFIASSCARSSSYTSCDFPNGGNNRGHCQVYEKGHLVEIYECINDSTIIIGDHETFIRNGKSYQFYTNGDTLCESYYRNNKLIRNYYCYYKGGRIKQYVYFDFNSDTLYSRLYDVDGVITKESGELFYEEGYTGISSLMLNSDSIVEVVTTVIRPPNSDIKIQSFVTLDSDKGVDTIQPISNGYLPDEDNGIYIITFKLEKHSRYEIYVNTKLDDPDKGKTWTKEEGYTFTFPIKSKNR